MQADWPVWQHCNSEPCCQAEAQKARSDPPLSQWMYHTWPESKPAGLSLLTSAMYSAGVGAGKGWIARTGIEWRWWGVLIDNQGSRFSLHSPCSRLKNKSTISRWTLRRSNMLVGEVERGKRRPVLSQGPFALQTHLFLFSFLMSIEA